MDVIQFLEIKKDCKIIEIGTGLGDLISHREDAIGLDLNSKTIAAAKFKNRRNVFITLDCFTKQFIEILQDNKEKKILLLVVNVFDHTRLKKFISFLKNNLKNMEIEILFDIQKNHKVNGYDLSWMPDIEDLRNLGKCEIVASTDKYRNLTILTLTC